MNKNESTDSDETEDIIREIVCIYKKIKQGREYQTYAFKSSLNKDDNNKESIFDFNTHSLNGSKYLYFDEQVGLIQSDKMVIPTEKINAKKNNSKDDLDNNSSLKDNSSSSSTFVNNFFWLNIFDPTQEDFDNFSKNFNVHETTIADIREKNSPEKIDVYRNYAFISLKMFVNKKTREDINFNIIIFDDFVITTHNKKWQGISNILNFCYVISQATCLEPSWVVFSIITEFIQDVVFYCNEIENQQDSFSMKHSVKDLQHNFSYLHNVLVLKRFIKPKMKIIRKLLKTDFPHSSVSKFLRDSLKDFRDLRKLLSDCKKSFERNQDMILALRDIELAEQGNKMNLMISRISKVTFFFLPIQCVAGLWGMNVKVPFDEDRSSCKWFWILTLTGPILCFIYFFFTESIGSFYATIRRRRVGRKEEV